MNRERLETLADFLDTVDQTKFNLAVWYVGFVPEDFTADAFSGCGTVACAFGWACTIPEFQAAGLRMNPMGEPSLDGATGFLAAQRFFEIDGETALHLFASSEYQLRDLRDPTAVADRIRELLA